MTGIAALALAALAAFAQNTDTGNQPSSPGPTGAPAPNINAGGNPTAPARLPSQYTNDPNQPTFPSSRNKPSSTGGTVVDDPAVREDEPRTQEERRRKFREERRNAEPQQEVNPGAVQGGPQP